MKSGTPMQPDRAISALCSKPENCDKKTCEVSPLAVSSQVSDSHCINRPPKSPGNEWKSIRTINDIILLLLDSLCGHRGDSAQVLCYFCHQRNKRNIYVDTSTERKATEINYEKVLHDYQEKKHSLASAKERKAKKTSGLFAKDASLHNYKRSQEKVSQLF